MLIPGVGSGTEIPTAPVAMVSSGVVAVELAWVPPTCRFTATGSKLPPMRRIPTFPPTDVMWSVAPSCFQLDTPAAAQWWGEPVWNSPKGGTGVTISGDTGTTFGAVPYRLAPPLRRGRRVELETGGSDGPHHVRWRKRGYAPHRWQLAAGRREPAGRRHPRKLDGYHPGADHGDRCGWDLRPAAHAGDQHRAVLLARNPLPEYQPPHPDRRAQHPVRVCIRGQSELRPRRAAPRLRQ